MKRVQSCCRSRLRDDGGADIRDLGFCDDDLQLHQKGLFLQITQVDLPRHGKHKQGYKKVKTKDDQARASAGDSIEQRPPEVESREEFGHWEGDTVYSGRANARPPAPC